jgi:hypothetical protein
MGGYCECFPSFRYDDQANLDQRAAKGIVVSSSPSGAFREFKVYDNARQGRDWMSLVGPTQCAVFFKDFRTAVPLSRDGAAFDKMTDCTFLIFDQFEDARHFCEAQVKQYTSMCCEVYDSDGKAKPPLLVVVNSSLAEKDELSASWVRRRKIMAIGSFGCAIPLLVWDWTTGSYLILPTVVGINLIVLGLRLLYWNTARSDRSKEQARRLKNHLRREQESGGKSE